MREKETQTIKKVALSARAIEKMKNDSFKADIGENEGLRVYKGKTGLTSFIYRYRSPINNSLKKMKIGTFPEMSLAEARLELQKLKKVRRSGVCPSTVAKLAKAEKLNQLAIAQEVEVRNNFTVRDLVELYLTNVIEDRIILDIVTGQKKIIKGSRNEKGQKEARRTLYSDVIPILGDIPAELITRKEVVQLVFSIVERGANVQAGRVIAELNLAYEYAIGLEKFKDDFANPALLAKASLKLSRLKLTATKGKRVLSDDELKKVIKWLPTSGYAEKHKQVLKVALWTGCRTGEICSMEWDDVNLSSKTWHLKNSKNGAERYVQLSQQCVEYLQSLRKDKSKYVFQLEDSEEPVRQRYLGQCKWQMKNPDKISHKHKLRDEQLWLNSIPDWSPHDLRRTVRTGLSRLGCPTEIAEAVLGHSKKGIQGTYDLHSYEKECAEWLQRWANYIESISI